MKKQLTYLFAFLSIIASPCHGKQPVLRIMPLGDSITQGCCSGSPVFGGYRSKLYDLLTLGGVAVDFVGTLSDPQNNGTLPDRDHQGYPGATIEILRSNIVDVFTKVPSPDIILLDIGTNNFWNGDQPIAVSIQLKALIEQISTQSPNSVILVSNLLLRTDCHADLQNEFSRDDLQALVNDEIALGRHVAIADLHSALLGSDLTTDRVHPTIYGYNKMAVAWYRAIKQATGGLLTEPVEILVNGGFESAQSNPTSNLSFGPYAVDGWLASGTPSEWTTSWNPVLSTTEGSKILFFNGGGDSYDGSIFQSFRTVPGTIYQLSFDAGIVVSESWAPRQQMLGVLVRGSSELFTNDVTLYGAEGKAQWFPQKFYFTADSDSTTLKFSDKSRNLVGPTAQYCDLLLDNVHLIVSPNDPRFVAYPQAITVKTGMAFGIKLGGDLGSSVRPENFTISMKPSHGTLSSAGDDLAYTPEPGYTGNDSFAFVVGNGIMCSTPAVVSICVVPADSATLSNGSFENGALVGGPAAGCNLDGWQVTGSPVGLGTSWNSRLSATAGERVAFFNPGSDAFGGSISQSFATVPGLTYVLTFDTGIVVSETWAPRQQQLWVKVQGNNLILSNPVSLIGQEGSATWSSRRFEFIADGSSTNLSFTDRSADLVNPGSRLSDMLLDNVQISVKTDLPAFNEWAIRNGISSNGLEDSDNDAIPNIVEYVIGGNPTRSNDQWLLPVGTRVIADPDGKSGLARYFLFQYRRTLSSASDSKVHTKVEYSLDLRGPWLDAGTDAKVKSVLTTDDLISGSELVKVYFPASLEVNGKLFVRLAVSRY